MRKFGLIGYPLGHSFSRKYFNEKFSAEHLEDCSYDNYALKDIGMLKDLIGSDPALCGLNVTIPYKTAVLRFLDAIDAEAEAVGAVNVLKIKRRGNKYSLSGFNSDITGIYDSLKPLLRPDVRDAIVLGTGGASKAVCYVLDKISVHYTLISRTPKPGCLTYNELVPGILDRARLIINTTPLGMYPDTGTFPDLKYDLLTGKHILFDLVYNPEMTVFLRKGQERGCTTLNGMKMLISQAERSWEIWNDENL